MVASITLNIVLVPKFGINGGAMATLLSYLIFYVFLLWFVQKKVGTTPFSWNLLKVVGLIGLLYLLNVGCHFVSSHLITSTSIVPWLAEAVIRTGFICAIGVYILYRWNISPEVNLMIQKVIAKMKRSS